MVLKVSALIKKIAIKHKISVLVFARVGARHINHQRVTVARAHLSLSLIHSVVELSIYSTFSKPFSIALEEKAPGSIAEFEKFLFRVLLRQLGKPLGKLRINAQSKNPATITIRELQAHRESEELVDSSVGQT